MIACRRDGTGLKDRMYQANLTDAVELYSGQLERERLLGVISLGFSKAFDYWNRYGE